MTGSVAQTCIPRYYAEGSSFVCVCNSTYCDTAPKVDGLLQPGQAVVISSSQAQDRFSAVNAQFETQASSLTSISLIFKLILCLKLQ